MYYVLCIIVGLCLWRIILIMWIFVIYSSLSQFLVSNITKFLLHFIHGNSKQLFSTVNQILQPETPIPVENTEERCNDFMTFFKAKINSIRSAFPGPPDLSVLTINPQRRKREQGESGGSELKQRQRR
uniref:Uncharacterized protein n=1 Tax=Paramormyrops kingsleyae TaxID=1676925 RepID=A0A3B3S0U8_9TELE